MKLPRGASSLLSVFAVFVVLGSAAAWRIHEQAEDSDVADGSELPSTEGVEVPSAELFAGAQAVEGAEVIRDTLWIQVVASGTAEAYRRTVVTARRETVVEQVKVRENDFVQEGEHLVQLDTAEAAMELAEAEARLRSAQNEYEAGMLAGGQIDDPSIREERERNLRIQVGLVEAETALRRAELEMELTRVAAPFAGRVADLTAVEGAYRTAGSKVLTLAQLDPIRVQVQVLESELPLLEEGRRADVRFAALPDDRFDASVESLNPLVDVETRSGRVTVVLPNPGARIKPGMYATVRLDAQAYPDRVLVPREAVVERGQPRREVVFVLRDADESGRGRSEWRYVTTGVRNDTHVEILPSDETARVEPGEIVLVEGHHYLAHDVLVRLVEEVSGAGGPGDTGDARGPGDVGGSGGIDRGDGSEIGSGEEEG
ncbi:MAG: efflux RND transporter periplasmic adaptor subunit [Longimicrobiales bacterium]|nr:efflux RND transporter periplasmic adaptor subunit [Longimicrobiales bacterium]